MFWLDLVLNAGAVMLIVAIVNGGEGLEFWPSLGIGVAIGILSFIAGSFLGESMGLFALAPVSIIAALVFWVVSGLTLGRAAIAGGIFLVYAVAKGFLFQALLG